MRERTREARPEDLGQSALSVPSAVGATRLLGRATAPPAILTAESSQPNRTGRRLPNYRLAFQLVMMQRASNRPNQHK